MNQVQGQPAQGDGDQPSPLRNPSAPDPRNEPHALAQYARVIGSIAVVVGAVAALLIALGVINNPVAKYLSPAAIVVGVLLNIAAIALRKR